MPLDPRGEVRDGLLKKHLLLRAIRPHRLSDNASVVELPEPLDEKRDQRNAVAVCERRCARREGHFPTEDPGPEFLPTTVSFTRNANTSP